VTAPVSAPAVAGDPSMEFHTHDARHRMQRALFFASGIGAVVFGALLATGGGGIIAQMDQLAPVYAWATLSVVILLPAAFVVVSFIVPMRVLYAQAATVSIGFVVAELLWIPAMTVDVLENDASPWLQGVTAMAATITAVRWRGPWVWLYAIATGPIVAVNQVLVREDATLNAILDGLGGMVFSLILMGVAMAVVDAADRQDAVAARARSQAALEASRRTREREQTRINAIVHDDVMSVLLTASRKAPAPGLALQAQRALDAIAAIAAGDGELRVYTSEELAAVLRSTVTSIAADVDFTYAFKAAEPIPAEVVAATTEALAEAMRNSVKYAGVGDEPVERTVHLDVTAAGFSVRVRDRGRGFSPRAVEPRRLGIRVSIVERMASVAGGKGDVHSRPGAGTTVELSWRRP
jgi:signal transduction histidine kinase